MFVVLGLNNNSAVCQRFRRKLTYKSSTKQKVHKKLGKYCRCKILSKLQPYEHCEGLVMKY